MVNVSRFNISVALMQIRRFIADLPCQRREGHLLCTPPGQRIGSTPSSSCVCGVPGPHLWFWAMLLVSDAEEPSSASWTSSCLPTGPVPTCWQLSVHSRPHGSQCSWCGPEKKNEGWEKVDVGWQRGTRYPAMNGLLWSLFSLWKGSGDQEQRWLMRRSGCWSRTNQECQSWKDREGKKKKDLKWAEAVS